MVADRNDSDPQSDLTVYSRHCFLRQTDIKIRSFRPLSLTVKLNCMQKQTSNYRIPLELRPYNPFTGGSTPFMPFVNKIPMEEDNYVSLAHTYKEEIVLDSDIASDPTLRMTQNPNFTILPSMATNRDAVIPTLIRMSSHSCRQCNNTFSSQIAVAATAQTKTRSHTKTSLSHKRIQNPQNSKHPTLPQIFSYPCVYSSTRKCSVRNFPFK